jgi:hypothetical protein
MKIQISTTAGQLIAYKQALHKRTQIPEKDISIAVLISKIILNMIEIFVSLH